MAPINEDEEGAVAQSTDRQAENSQGAEDDEVLNIFFEKNTFTREKNEDSNTAEINRTKREDRLNNHRMNR